MKLKFTFTSDPRRLAEVRSCVRSFLTKCGFDECSIELLVLGLDEACTNVIRHAYGHNVLRDYGRSCDPECIRSRNLEDVRPGGVGVHIIRQVFDYVKYEPCRRGTRLVLEKKFAEDSRIYSRG